VRRNTVALGAVLVAAMAVAVGVTAQRAGAPVARFVREVPWSQTGQWIAADTHVHTRFSDGGATIPELLDKGTRFGCRALAFTDHADRKLSAATPAYRDAIQAARTAYPNLIVAAGLEWNVPPWGGEEHMTLLLPPGQDEWATLAQFKDRFDDFQLEDRPKPGADAALRWLDTTTAGQRPRPVVIYNHPSRADAASIQNVDDIRRWRGVNDLVVGFEGAPGHQGREPVGSYSNKEKTIDRWDPVAARPGDAWDTLLQRGIDVTAALANSDFHNQNPNDLNDYWPCEFAESWVKVPDTTVAGLLDALRAGTTFAAHGHIARDVELTISASGLPRPAGVGEVIAVRRDAVVTASLTLTIPELDWKREPNHVDSVELIVVRPSRVDVVTLPIVGRGRQSVSAPLTVGDEGLVVRARGRRIVADGPDLMFYTNPIRVTVAQR
jgi:hypothetical protein